MGLVSVEKASAELGISRSMLYALVREHKISHYKFGDRVVLDVEEVRAEMKIKQESDAAVVSYAVGRPAAIAKVTKKTG
jgi:excisionase family DNA binding protein